MLATRGCPGRCTFCHRIFGNRLRWRTGRNVAEELRLLNQRYGIREICFYDDTFTVVKREVREFCRAVLEMRLDMAWSCFSRVDTFDEETFRMMKRARCHQVMYGIGTCDEDILKNIGKNLKGGFDEKKVREVVSATRRIGLEVRAAFMLGNPGETEESMERTIRFAVSLDPDIAIFNVTTPYPGTEMFEWADANGYLITRDWNDYDLSRPVMELPTVPSRKVLASYQAAHLRFFLRPRYILRRLKTPGSVHGIMSSIMGARSVLKV